MKIKSLLLGSVAAAGLTTGAYAADLGVVLTSLDVCDSLGISGLTISSDTNCLKISGEVEYSFKWGDYTGGQASVGPTTPYGAPMPIVGGVTVPNPGFTGATDVENDWESNVDASLTFEASGDSSFGTAKGVITIDYNNDYNVVDEGALIPGNAAITATTATPTTALPLHFGNVNPRVSSGLSVSEAYVAVGDTTILSAGLRDSIAREDDDEPYNYLGLFNSSALDDSSRNSAGVAAGLPPTGGHGIHIVHDMGNGFSVGAALENINGSSPTVWGYDGVAATADDIVTGSTAADGTFVGVLAYDGAGISAHSTFYAGGVLDGVVENWANHTGVTAEFDMFKVRGAGSFASSGAWNVLGTGEASFDMFTLAASGEATNSATGVRGAGFGVSAGAAVTDTVEVNVGFRWFDSDTALPNTEGYQAAVQLIANLTETIELTGEVGVYGESATATTVPYFSGELAWAPSEDLEVTAGGEAYSTGAYSVSFGASKEFE